MMSISTVYSSGYHVTHHKVKTMVTIPYRNSGVEGILYCEDSGDFIDEASGEVLTEEEIGSKLLSSSKASKCEERSICTLEDVDQVIGLLADLACKVPNFLEMPLTPENYIGQTKPWDLGHSEQVNLPGDINFTLDTNRVPNCVEMEHDKQDETGIISQLTPLGEKLLQKNYHTGQYYLPQGIYDPENIIIEDASKIVFAEETCKAPPLTVSEKTKKMFQDILHLQMLTLIRAKEALWGDNPFLMSHLDSILADIDAAMIGVQTQRGPGYLQTLSQRDGQQEYIRHLQNQLLHINWKIHYENENLRNENVDLRNKIQSLKEQRNRLKNKLYRGHENH